MWNIGTSPQEYALLMEAGFVYRYARRFQEAREIFQSILAVQPFNEMGEIALGGVSFDEGNFDDAITHCSNAILLNPKSAMAYTQLGEAQLFKGDADGARLSLRKAIDADPRGVAARALLKLIDARLVTKR